jgi:PKD repeat protein
MTPPTHVYTTVATFIVVLTVDDGAMTDSTQLEITVRKSKGGRK